MEHLLNVPREVDDAGSLEFYGMGMRRIKVKIRWL